jgi:hypothetical protein
VQTHIADASASQLYRDDKAALDKFRANYKARKHVDWNINQKDEYWSPVEVRSDEGLTVTVIVVIAYGRLPPVWIFDVVKALDAGEAAYIQFWENTLAAAVEFSKAEHREASGFNVMSRFLTVPANRNLGIELFLVVNKWNSNRHAELEAAMTDAITKVGNDFPGQVTFHVISNQQLQNDPGLIELPSHPLGFYKTYAHAAIIDKLAELQVGNGRWIRDFPQGRTVLDNLNAQLLQDTGSKFRMKMVQITDQTTTKTELQHGVAIDSAKREQTERIMGSSANKVGDLCVCRRPISDLFLYPVGS